MDIKGYLKEICGREPIEKNNFKAEIWRQWYAGKVDSFHSYQQFNGQRTLNRQKRSLMMAKTVSEDWANLLGNENTQIKIKEEDQDKLNTILRENNFSVLLNDCIEKSFALGNGYLLLGLDNFNLTTTTGKIIPSEETKITIDFIDSLHAIPLNIERKRLTEVAFVSESTKGKQVAAHLKDNNGNYVIRLAKFDDKEQLIPDSEVVINTNSKLAWFVHIKPNINNNSFYYGDLGCSIFANAIDVLKTIDEIYDGFSNEYTLARMKVFVTERLFNFKQDDNGNMVKNFDPNDDLFYLVESSDQDKTLIQSEAPNIRYEAYIQGLNTTLNELSKKCGFGTEYYKFDKGSIMTATQVISENSDLARSLRKQENLVRAELIKLTMAIMFINNEYTKKERFSDNDINDINVLFDDSVIEDRGTLMTRDRENVSAGLMTEAEFRAKYLGLEKEEAENDYVDKFLYRELNKYLPSLQANVITPEEFINKTYGENYSNKNELIEMITKALEKASYNPLEAWDDEHSNDQEPQEEQLQEEEQPQEE